MEEMRKRLVDAIKGCCDELCGDCDWESCETCSLFDEFQKEADALLLAGVLVPPVKLGDTVYAVVDLDDGPEVNEYTVSGVAYSNGAWYACANNIEFNKVGDYLCLLTREEAEAVLEKMRRARDGDQ